MEIYNEEYKRNLAKLTPAQIATLERVVCIVIVRATLPNLIFMFQFLVVELFFHLRYITVAESHMTAKQVAYAAKEQAAKDAVAAKAAKKAAKQAKKAAKQQAAKARPKKAKRKAVAAGKRQSKSGKAARGTRAANPATKTQ